MGQRTEPFRDLQNCGHNEVNESACRNTDSQMVVLLYDQYEESEVFCCSYELLDGWCFNTTALDENDSSDC